MQTGASEVYHTLRTGPSRNRLSASSERRSVCLIPFVLYVCLLSILHLKMIICNCNCCRAHTEWYSLRHGHIFLSTLRSRARYVSSKPNWPADNKGRCVQANNKKKKRKAAVTTQTRLTGRADDRTANGLKTLYASVPALAVEVSDMFAEHIPCCFRSIHHVTTSS